MTTETADTTASPQTPSTRAIAEGPGTVFEQPLNERMRTFLRLDFLYNQALYHNETGTQWGSRAAVGSLIDILAIVTRTDLRSDALKEIERQLVLLGEYQAKPGVDPKRLERFIDNLNRLRGDLMNAGIACQQPLRESEFLNAIKHRSSIPGGTCEFDLPDYLCWLTEPEESRMLAFGQWISVLRPLCDAVAELLWLTRQFGRSRREVAQGGTFTINFDRDNPLQLLRITLPTESRLYPEISGSHHRCSVRFLSWKGVTERATQTGEDVPFLLTTCR